MNTAEKTKKILDLKAKIKALEENNQQLREQMTQKEDALSTFDEILLLRYIMKEPSFKYYIGYPKVLFLHLWCRHFFQTLKSWLSEKLNEKVVNISPYFDKLIMLWKEM